MPESLCQTFRALAFRTFDSLGRARRVKHQPLEETFTDLNILDLRERHPSQIYSYTFSKYAEGRNGADWEWWLTNSAMDSWLGIRVQAKVLNLKSNRFEHLHYKSGKPKEYQLDKLLRESSRDGLIPLYCLYLNTDSPSAIEHDSCHSYPYAIESYGCAIASPAHIQMLQLIGVDDLSSVISSAHPWHCLVCCSGFGGDNLPTRALSFLQKALSIQLVASHDIDRHNNIAGIRREAPGYVYAALEGRESDGSPKNVRAVVIVKDGDGEQERG